MKAMSNTCIMQSMQLQALLPGKKKNGKNSRNCPEPMLENSKFYNNKENVEPKKKKQLKKQIKYS